MVEKKAINIRIKQAGRDDCYCITATAVVLQNEDNHRDNGKDTRNHCQCECIVYKYGNHNYLEAV